MVITIWAQHFRSVLKDPGLFDRVRSTIAYEENDSGRGTGYVYPAGGPWVPEMAGVGPGLLDLMERILGLRFEVVAVQGYRDGDAWTDWHADDPWDAQAILSLGATRTLRVRANDAEARVIDIRPLADGDLLYMPPGYQKQWSHMVPKDPGAGERVALVFRTIRRG